MPVEQIAPELQASSRLGGGVCIRKLLKIYTNTLSGIEIIAVNDLTLTMFQGQVRSSVESCEDIICFCMGKLLG